MLTVFGSMVLDTIHTPHGTYTDELGGASTYAAIAASHFVKTNLIARGGSDISESQVKMLQNIMDMEGLGGLDGRTFRYEARYLDNFQTREDIRVEPNIPEGYRPNVPEKFQKSKFVYLANEDPVQQMAVLEQFDGPDFVMCDTIGYWIQNKRSEVIDVMGSMTAVIINDEEARELIGTYSLVKCARSIAEWGARHVIIKKGAHGSILFSGDRIFPLPAYPIEDVTDPTGAGDSFAGAFMGYLASKGSVDVTSLRRACMYGNVLGSFVVEHLGTDGLLSLNMDMIHERIKQYDTMLYLE